MNPTSHLTHRNLDQLEADIVSLSTHINAQEYEFLVLLREFELRQVWKVYHSEAARRAACETVGGRRRDQS